MRAGQLDRLWTLQRKSVTQDASGFEVETWQNMDQVWGSFEPIRGQERWAAAQVVATDPVRVRIRYYPGLTPLDAIYDTEEEVRYDVHSVEDYRRDGEQVLTVSRRVGE